MSNVITITLDKDSFDARMQKYGFERIAGTSKWSHPEVPDFDDMATTPNYWQSPSVDAV